MHITITQVDGINRHLGTYELEEDAARVFDKVARILGKDLNFPTSDTLDINGWRSERADEMVTAVVKEANEFVEWRCNLLDDPFGLDKDPGAPY